LMMRFGELATRGRTRRNPFLTFSNRSFAAYFLDCFDLFFARCPHVLVPRGGNERICGADARQWRR
jgi:hypothetical protein